MDSRDLKLAIGIVAACFVFSGIVVYVYARGWFASSGLFPLIFTVIVVLGTTVVFECLGHRAKVSYETRIPETQQAVDDGVDAFGRAIRLASTTVLASMLMAASATNLELESSVKPMNQLGTQTIGLAQVFPTQASAASNQPPLI
jgi:hypothetical protein